tara:strand:- start:243 stop:665 length:423 start_codon:yes stop_codon:yes gene_type:complete
LSPPNVVVGIKKVGLLAMAGICFALGCLGALLPGLPATPFLLLTSFLLLRSSPKLNARLRRSKMFGPILTDWEDLGGVRSNVKAKAILVVAISVGLTVYFGPAINWLRSLVVILATIGVVVIWRLPVARSPEKLPDGDSV